MTRQDVFPRLERLNTVGGCKLSILALWIGLAVTATVSAAEPWRFIMTCDSRGNYITGINAPILSELADEILSRDVDFVLFAGDLVYGARVGPEQFGAQLWDWVRVMEPVYDAGIPVYVCRGNHEVGDMWDAAPDEPPDPLDNCAFRWLNVFGNDDYPELMLPDNGPAPEKYMSYSVRHKNVLVVALDQYAGTRHHLAHDLNQSWLDSQLETNTRPHVFVFGHEPAFRALHWDCLDYHPARRDTFWRSLQLAGGRAYFCGHDHFYDHARVDDGDGNPDNDIHQFIVGGAGAYPYAWTPPYDGNNSDFSVSQVSHAERYGYLLIEVAGLDVTVTWMERQGSDVLQPGVYEANDVWTYTVTPGPVVVQPNGGERILADRPYTVKWRTIPGGELRRVAIGYSLDGGATWARADEVDNTGAYVWLPPDVHNENCLVRVADARDTTVYDTSDGPFSIVPCRANLTADLNGDCLVDFADLAILAAEWLAGGTPTDPADGVPK